MSTLQCPKCQAPMRAFERSGVTVDRCTECGGLFLDRGEIERLAEAEGGFYDRPRGRDDDEWEGEREGHGRRRRRGFLGELLDFG